MSHDTVLMPVAAGRSGAVGAGVVAAGQPSSTPAPGALAVAMSEAGRAASAPAVAGTPAASAPARAGAGGSAQAAPVTTAGTPAPPAVGSGGMAAGASDPECDLGGVWIGKQVAIGTVLELPQSVNTWHYLEISQTGDQLMVTRSYDCGVEVVGNVSVKVSRATMQGAVMHNSQAGRKGTIKKSGSSCALEIERFWSIRGADEQRFVPELGRNSSEPLPTVSRARPLPTAMMTAGAIDTESDGKLGIAAQVSGIATGTRNSVQREWNRWFSAPGYEITPSASWTSELTLRAEYDIEENVIDPTEGLLTTVPQSSDAYKHIMRLRFLGRSTADARAAAFIKADPVETCYAIQDAMPAETLE